MEIEKSKYRTKNLFLPLEGEDRGVLIRKSYGRTPSEALAKEGGGDTLP